MSDSLLKRRLARLISTTGPIPVSTWMTEANAHYYAARDPFGEAGDFTTAPEISQMFGELIGLWLVDLWIRAGRPEGAALVELGPGRGTLAADALRAMRGAGLEPEVHFVEASPLLRSAQAERVPEAAWYNDVTTLPDDRPLLIVANEFFDALPIRQLVATRRGWHERLVAYADGAFVPVPGPLIPAPLAPAETGTIVETSPASASTVRELARRLAAQGGAALIADYGHVRSGIGETLQAVSSHGFADPWDEPGARDLTAHVDFEALCRAAEGQGVRLSGPRPQGEWLQAMGIDARAAALAGRAPDRSSEIEDARDRLVSPDRMGTLFKMLALTSPDWPEPEGFA
ncbi:class I SAM-dependent methyltransferase [Allosphingosinicella sp.]|uniref:class I SAM-dependent methyltransferase n=1 Tax=Allosphingosinicella sp. TaxID=2823234 RepID=UPI003D74012B